jgi:hypothetical protein
MVIKKKQGNMDNVPMVGGAVGGNLRNTVSDITALPRTLGRYRYSGFVLSIEPFFGVMDV